jgi:membrane fusion protein (multidrug efflux system)
MDRTEARERETMEVALDEARARFAEADALATLAVQDAARLTALHQRRLVSDRDLAEADVEARRRRSAAESLRLVVSRLESEQHSREAERDVTRKRLLGDISRLEGERTTASATVGRIEFEAERRLVRAPVGGRIGEAQVLRPGAYVRAGETLGAIVPDGVLRIVAEFPPSALGRVRPGQPAKLRLRGFPWAEYGVVHAVVTAVAGEIRDGHVRVELGVSAQNAARVPLQHGLPGTVEVEVEQVTPALLVFRAAGQLVASTANQPSDSTP